MMIVPESPANRKLHHYSVLVFHGVFQGFLVPFLIPSLIDATFAPR
jgi:hypothetical protein